MSNLEDKIDENILEENKKSYKEKQMKEWNEKDVKDFLKENGFKEDIINKFENCNGNFLSELKEEQCIRLLKDEFQGTFLYNCISSFEKGK